MATKGIVFAGRTIKIPGAYGFGDASGLVEVNLGALNVLMMVGESEGGEPNKPLFFGVASQERALRAIRGGPLHVAMRAAWNPSPDSNIKGADVIIAVRANPATQAQLTLLDTQVVPVTAITIKARDWGKHGNDVQLGILAGSVNVALRRVVLKKVSDGIDMTSADLGSVFAIAYSGNGTATVDVNIVAGDPTLVVAVTGATDGTSGFTVNLTLKAVRTIERLAAFVGSQAGFNVKVVGSPQMKSSWLDPIGLAQAIGTTAAPTTVFGINGAVTDWINRNAPAAVATLVSSTAKVALSGTAFLIGGTEGATTLQHWKNAFAKLAMEPGYFLCPLTDDELVHSAALEHILAMSDVKMKRRRTGYFGHGIGDVVFNPDGSVDISALAERIFKLNSDRVVFVTPGVLREDDGEEVMFGSWLTAVLLAGIKAGGDPQMSLTGKYINCLGLEGDFDPTVEEELIDAAATYVTKVPDKGFKIGLGQLAQLRTTNTLASEPSVLHVSDTILKNLEDFLGDKYTGIPPTSRIRGRLDEIKSDVVKMLDKAAKRGMLVGGLDATGKPVGPYRNIRVTFADRTYAVEFEASIAEPGNYITILAHWTAVTGSV